MEGSTQDDPRDGMARPLDTMVVVAVVTTYVRGAAASAAEFKTSLGRVDVSDVEPVA